MAIVLDGSSAAGVLNLGTNGTITNLAEGGLPDGKVTSADLKSTSGTAGASTYYRGDQTWGTVSGGIEEYDEWRIHTTFDPNSTSLQTLTANWERNDTDFTHIGTGMTQSSGVFTFPSTGIWYIECTVAYVCSSQMRYCYACVSLTTDDGSNWNQRAQPHSGRDACSPNGFVWARASAGFDVTSVSDCKARMQVRSSVSSAGANAASDANYTYMTFRKLGPT